MAQPLAWQYGLDGRRSASPSRAYTITKRLFDLSVTCLLLVGTLPVWLLIALAITIDSPGPVLFRQTRVGRKGRSFTLYKFRSMHVNEDDGIHRAYVRDFIRFGTPGHTLYGVPYFKLRGDRRVSRIGSWLRKTSLDELPNFLNVLCGEMSVVGPRPTLPYEVEHYQDWHRDRFEGLPGVTGIWQAYGRSRVTFDEMVRMDIAYLQRASLWLDLKLILLTFRTVLSGAGAD